MAVELVIVVFLVLLGIALLLAEVFLLPGITVAGIAGALSLAGGVVYAFIHLGSAAGFITVVSSAVLFAACFAFLVKSNAMSHIGLKTDIEAKVDQPELHQLKSGDAGQAVSRLNPIGKAEFNSLTVEAKSVTGEYIDEGQPVVIVKVEANNVLVKLAEQ
jgi:membrane-bound ClpP family serine protease